jgi:predicted nucleic acid-binding protein
LSSVVAVLDTCVMVPLVLCDTMLRAAERRLYAVRWSEIILTELRRTLAEKLPLGEERAQRRINAQREHFPEATIRGFEPLIDDMTNHPKDRHVLAAAVVGQASVIVAFNLRDFPKAATLRWGVIAEPPDRFLSRLFSTTPDQLIDIIDEQAVDTRQTWDAVLARLARDGAPTFAQQVRAAIQERQPTLRSTKSE